MNDYRFGKSIIAGLTPIQNLADIENELGISLLKLFAALKQGKLFINCEEYGIRESVVEGWGGTYLMCNHGEIKLACAVLLPCEPREVEVLTHMELRPEDYGKTWALTKEELEGK